MPDPDLIATLVTALAIARGEPEAVVRTRFGIERTQPDASPALVRRIDAAIFATRVSRSAAEFDWPECHKRNCRERHGSTDDAFGIFAYQVAESVRAEILAESTTRPDVWVDGDEDPSLLAVYALATLIGSLVSKAGTHVRAAALLIDAYPSLGTFPDTP